MCQLDCEILIQTMNSISLSSYTKNAAIPILTAEKKTIKKTIAASIFERLLTILLLTKKRMIGIISNNAIRGNKIDGEYFVVITSQPLICISAVICAYTKFHEVKIDQNKEDLTHSHLSRLYFLWFERHHGFPFSGCSRSSILFRNSLYVNKYRTANTIGIDSLPPQNVPVFEVMEIV